MLQKMYAWKMYVLQNNFFTYLRIACMWFAYIRYHEEKDIL